MLSSNRNRFKGQYNRQHKYPIGQCGKLGGMDWVGLPLSWLKIEIMATARSKARVGRAIYAMPTRKDRTGSPTFQRKSFAQPRETC